MGRTKSTAKRARQGEMQVEPPPQGHPMEKFFTNLADFNIDFSNILQKGLKGPNCINYATLRQMGRGLGQEQPQQAPQDQAGQSEQEHQVGPSEQPSMRDMMQVLLRIEQQQANMDTHLTRVDQRLSRIEQHLETDEDEDQD
ncbi:hypothetical protein PIB30_107888 [Stylosanthes scabra]|uniref:Uncharacterized protein n=1 Tax=Stylosanthes scabra TaxID=79078 RepID=A0ABU6WXJ9_9FABA|nr:hypothetical protein [Stylosanthes scabra]